jgi:superfamily II DNA helicase RecQ
MSSNSFLTPIKQIITNRGSANAQDKVEYSPNNLAKCRKCHLTIFRGQVRIGVSFFNEKYDSYSFAYYHEHCCPESCKEHLHLPSGGRIKDELRVQEERERNVCRILEHRRGLREDLRKLRIILANRADIPPYYIFADTTLNDLVVKMPRNKFELKKCRGIAETKCKMYGMEILRVIRDFRRKLAAGGQDQAEQRDEQNPIQETPSLERNKSHTFP